MLQWANEYDCKWLKDKDVNSFVVKVAVMKLATPLSLKDFALSSKNCVDIVSVSEKITEKSKEVKEAFAEEIASMNKEKILFLNLVCLLIPLDPEIIKALYGKYCNEFGLDAERNPFDLLEVHFCAKINRETMPNREETEFRFTHPVYEEGIVTSWNRIEVRSSFLETADWLVKYENPRVRGSCGLSLVKNFEEVAFKNEAKKIIETVLCDKKAGARYGVAESISYYFKGISIELALQYLEIMSRDRNSSIRATVVEIIDSFISKIPMQRVLKFLTQGLEDKAAWVRLNAADTIMHNIEDLPKDLVIAAFDCLKKLSEYSGWHIRYLAFLSFQGFQERLKQRIFDTNEPS